MAYAINPQGFVTHWLLGGPVSGAYTPPADLPKTWTDQLGFEKTIRGIFYIPPEGRPAHAIRVGRPSPNGAPWRYYAHNRDWFVDVGGFSNNLIRIRLDAATILLSEKEQTVSAALWTYAAVDVWVNGQQLLGAHTPVYKPIRRYEIQLPLHKGENMVYVAMQNLGIRDTRNIFGLQLAACDGLAVTLPDAENTAPFARLEEWLSALMCQAGVLTVPAAPPCSCRLEYPYRPALPIAGPGRWEIPEDVGECEVRGTIRGTELSRRFELMEHRHRRQPAEGSGYRRQFIERLAAEKWEPRGNGEHFSVFHVLARRFLKRERPEDDQLLREDLRYIESCRDCSDFLVIGLIRLLKNYAVGPALQDRIREALLSFRYWMDEDGIDGMCYWSENHALMFHGAQMVVGQMYPDAVFARSGRTGREQEAIGAARCRAWLDDMERKGAEEFNSATYFPVTMTALLNLIDFGPADISARAAAVLDSLLRQLCLQVFRGSVVSPQGRVYRDVIYPFRQSVQSVLHMISAEFPDSDAENIWEVNLFTSRYRFPEGLLELARQPADRSYVSGNARIVLKKTADYMLTSVQCPRGADDAPEWHNRCFDPHPDRNANAYVQSLNERFHGTSVFRPGVYGYQQHLWYAAVSGECVVFTNHPGAAVDLSEMRPGYWHGNGVFPALRQAGSALGAIYEIPDSHPIQFTHVFWPTVKFDQSVQEGHWLFGRSGNGCVGLWCSGPLRAVDDVLHSCEYRCDGAEAAYYCLCGTVSDGSLADFAARCRETRPSFDPKSRTLTARGGYSLGFTRCGDRTQYV